MNGKFGDIQHIGLISGIGSQECAKYAGENIAGAEIFDEEIRQKICIGKKDANIWLNNARICHQKGLKTNCTMLYGHIEKYEHRIDHITPRPIGQAQCRNDVIDGFLFG